MQRFRTGARVAALAAYELEPDPQLRLEGGSEPVEEAFVRPGAERRGLRLYRFERRPLVESDGDRVVGRQQLDPEVVTARIMARACDHDRQAVSHRQEDRGRVDVAVLRELLPAPDRAHRVDAVDLAAGEPARDVEVVDVQVAED